MSRLIRQTSSSSLRRRKSGNIMYVLPDGDTSHLHVCQPRQSVSSVRKPQTIDTTPKQDRRIQVFLTAVDNRIDAGPGVAYSGPPLLFDIGASHTDFSSLELAARMTLMFADEVYFSQLTFYGQPPMWNHKSLKKSAHTFLKPWDVQYRCGVLPWIGWFGINSHKETADFLVLLQALDDGSLKCKGSRGDEEWACFSRRNGVLRVDLTARFVYRTQQTGKAGII